MADPEGTVHDAAGIIFREPGGKVLFLKRDSQANNGGQWDWPGGHLQPGEQLVDGAIREAHEETGYLAPKEDLRPVSRSITNDVDFSTFICDVGSKFVPNLERDEDGHREHDDFLWADPREPPEPLHEGIESVLSNDLIEDIHDTDAPTLESEPVAQDGLTSALRGWADDERFWLAFDKASVREYDAEGRLKVALTPISKANVCPYLGEEIPGFEEAGLDPKKVYRLLRDPEELTKAAPTFDLIPVLEVHEPTSAAEHPFDLVIGSTGTDCIFQDPYLMNSLAIWPDDAIDDVETEEKRELSSSYRYEVDWTPGVFRGAPYDGRMINIVGNHVATVEAGRAGADVLVADSLSDAVKWSLVEEAFRSSPH